MAPAYKLTYFNLRGIGEPARWLFKYGGVDFEDFRIEFTDWPSIKETTPFGQLPILEHKGVQITQSVAICRYLAKLVKLTGNNDWENLEIDAVVDTITDLRLKFLAYRQEQDESKKNSIKQALINEHIPYYFSRLEASAKGKNGYLVLERLTWADIYFTAITPLFDGFLGSDDVERSFSNYPTLAALQKRISALPGIKEWIEIRPKTAL